MKTTARAITLFILLLAMFSCSKEFTGEKLTKEEAIERLEQELAKHLEANDLILISNETVKSHTRLKWNEVGRETTDPDFHTRTITSPGYESWLVVVTTNPRYDHAMTKFPHFFVNVKNGKYKKVTLNGGWVIRDWDYKSSINAEYYLYPEERDGENPPHYWWERD